MTGRRGFIGSAIGLLIVGPWDEPAEPTAERFTLRPEPEDWDIRYSPGPPQPSKFTLMCGDGRWREVELWPGDIVFVRDGSVVRERL